MICSNCKTVNSYKANYCEKCGYKFTDEEKKEAYSKTLGGRIEKLEEAYSWLTLSKITGSLAFKILSLLLVLFVGLITFGKSELYINKDDGYTIQYNSVDKEYYLLYEEDAKRDISLNIPSKCEYLIIETYDINDDMIDTFNISKEESSLVLDESIFSLNIVAYSKNKVISSLKIRLY